MEVLFYLGGVLSVLYVYASYQAYKYKKEYTTLLDSLQSSQNISSIRYGEAIEKIDELRLYIEDVKSKLENDSYSDINEVNQRVGDVGNRLMTGLDRLYIVESNVKDIYNKIQDTNNAIRNLKEDPNFNNRY